MSTLGSAIRASASALSAERMRIEVAVSNLANAESTRGPDGQPYKRRDVVLQSASVQDFDNSLGRASAVGVEVAAVVEDQGPARRAQHVDHLFRRLDVRQRDVAVLVGVGVRRLVAPARAYQANLTAIGLIRDLVQRALELGRG